MQQQILMQQQSQAAHPGKDRPPFQTLREAHSKIQKQQRQIKGLQDKVAALERFQAYVSSVLRLPQTWSPSQAVPPQAVPLQAVPLQTVPLLAVPSQSLQSGPSVDELMQQIAMLQQQLQKQQAQARAPEEERRDQPSQPGSMMAQQIQGLQQQLQQQDISN
ncbi:homeobox protein abdominal-B-like [Drosophila takahashii]|uniref:homeobox protein abdominal-B-like n=1 Tax=Drosophila takahashii TaxID=29030 RepID=UPI0038994BC9